MLHVAHKVNRLEDMPNCHVFIYIIEIYTWNNLKQTKVLSFVINGVAVKLFVFIFLTQSALLSQTDYTLVATFPHSTASFTQGLFYDNGKLYEGTGQRKESKLLVTDPKTGKALHTHQLKDTYFGEGITRYNDKIIQLTWQSSTAFIYDFKTLKELRSVTYQSEGWGITYDGTYLIVSDGTDKLAFYEPESFTIAYDVTVSDWNGQVDKLNELEFVDGILFANIYQVDDIVSIDPSSGQVIERYDFSELAKKEREKNSKALELNGIAYNPKTKTFYVTGKYWANVYEVRLNK